MLPTIHLNPPGSVTEDQISRVEKGRRCGWWRRVKSRSKEFRYFDRHGDQIVDEMDLERIRSLAIPPAWKHVRISPSANGKLQAVGIDARGRLQYRYHPKFREKQDRLKFSKIERFGHHLPNIRRISSGHLALPGFPREKVLAVMIRLINSLYIRVGTDKSTRTFKTYGITTLRNRHLEIGSNGKLVFRFVGKSYVKHRKILVDKSLAAIMAELKDVGRSGKLFQYIGDDGRPRAVLPADINKYLKSLTSNEFSAKDFRTWGATLLAAVELAELGVADNDKALKTNIVRTVRKVAAQLGNTPAVCRGSYIHPLVFKAYADGLLLSDVRPRRIRRIRLSDESDYEPEEMSLLALFDRYRNNG